MPHQTLILLAKEVRSKTLKILDGLTDPQSHFAAPGLANSILWHAGHSLIVVEHLALSPMTGQPPTYPPAWFDIFSWKSNPKTVTAWPPLSEVRSHLTTQLEKITTTLPTLTESALAKVID